MSQPNRTPATASRITFPVKIYPQASTFFRSDRGIAMKSVPPLVTRTHRHRLHANPLIIPPKMQIKRMSSVMAKAGIMSVKILVSTMVRQE